MAIIKPQTVYKRRKYRHNLKIRKIAFTYPSTLALSVYPTQLYIPSEWTLTFLKSKTNSLKPQLLYLTNTLYYFKTPVPCKLSSAYFSYSSRTFLMHNLHLTGFHTYYLKVLQALLLTFSKLYYVKLKIRGKGYYLYKTTRNTLTHQLGHSHRVYIYAPYVAVKFLSKTTIFVFGLSKLDIFAIGRRIRKSKRLNIFTGRGVRFARQIIYKKTGKVSSYR